MKEKIIIFTRCSTDTQEIESQKKETKEYAISLGYNESDFIYIGSVGASAVKMNAIYMKDIEQLYSLLNSGSVSAVICWHLNRLARNDVKALEIKEMLIKTNTQLHVKEPSITLFNSNGEIDTGAELCFSIFATMSKQDAYELRMKFRRGKEKNRREGKYNGGEIKFGYSVDDNGKFIINPIEAEIVKELCEKYATGDYSYRDLIIEMKLRNVKIGLNKIGKILTDNEYTGTIKYPQIISNELREKCKSIAEKNKVNNFERKTVYPSFLNKILKCTCGRYYTSSMKMYECNGIRDIELKHKKHDIGISKNHIDGLIWLLCSTYELQDLINNSKDNKKEYSKEISNLENKIKLSNLKLTQLNNKSSRIKEMYLDGDLTKDEYKDKITKNNNQIKAIENDILHYNETITKLQRLINSTNKENTLIKAINSADTLHSSDIQTMERICKKWLKSGLIYDNNIIDLELINGKHFKLKYFQKKHAKNRGKITTIDGKQLLYPIFKINKDLQFTIDSCLSTTATTEDILITNAWLNGSKIINL